MQQINFKNMEDQFKPRNNEEKNFGSGEGVERQQTSEEILFVLEKAVESQEMIKIIFRSPDGKFSRKVFVIPWAFVEGVLWVTTESGEGISIGLSQIEKVEQKKDQDTPFEALPKTHFDAPTEELSEEAKETQYE